MKIMSSNRTMWRESSEMQNTEELIQKYHDSEAAKQLEGWYKRKSVLQITGVSRNENRHSEYLAWMLDDKESHGLGTYAFGQFLDMLATTIEGQRGYRKLRDDEKYFLGSNPSKGNWRQLSIERELVGDQGRPDLVMDCELISELSTPERKLRIVLENKVGSPETNNQTERYWEEYNQETDDNHVVIFIYLTPISSVGLLEKIEPDCSCKNFLHINYQMILDSIISPLQQKSREQGLHHTAAVFDDYVRCLSYVPVKSNTTTGVNFMAIGKEESDLLNQFIGENRNLLSLICQAVAYDNNQSEENRDSAEGATPGKSIKWDVSGKLRLIYDEMDSDEKIEWSDMIERVQKMCFNLYKKEPQNATVNTPLGRNVVNYPSRKSSGVRNPFPNNNTLFYICDNSPGRPLRKFIPHQGAEDVNIYWGEGNDIRSEKFGDIEDQFIDKHNYPEWRD